MIHFKVTANKDDSFVYSYTPCGGPQASRLWPRLSEIILEHHARGRNMIEGLVVHNEIICRAKLSIVLLMLLCKVAVAASGSSFS